MNNVSELLERKRNHLRNQFRKQQQNQLIQQTREHLLQQVTYQQVDQLFDQIRKEKNIEIYLKIISLSINHPRLVQYIIKQEEYLDLLKRIAIYTLPKTASTKIQILKGMFILARQVIKIPDGVKQLAKIGIFSVIVLKSDQLVKQFIHNNKQLAKEIIEYVLEISCFKSESPETLQHEQIKSILGYINIYLELFVNEDEETIYQKNINFIVETIFNITNLFDIGFSSSINSKLIEERAQHYVQMCKKKYSSIFKQLIYKLSQSKNEQVQVNITRLFVHLTYHKDQFSWILLQNHILLIIFNLHSCEQKEIRKNLASLLCNLALSSKNQNKERIIQNGLVQLYLKNYYAEKEKEVQVEIMMFLVLIMQNLSPTMLPNVVTYEVIQFYNELLLNQYVEKKEMRELLITLLDLKQSGNEGVLYMLKSSGTFRRVQNYLHCGKEQLQRLANLFLNQTESFIS